MVINTKCGQGMQTYAKAATYIHTNGCIDKLVNWIHSDMFLLGGIAMGLAIPQVEEHYAITHICCHTYLMTFFLPGSWLASFCRRYWSTRSKIRSRSRATTLDIAPTHGADHGQACILLRSAISALLRDFTESQLKTVGCIQTLGTQEKILQKEKTGLCRHLVSPLIAPTSALVCCPGSR